MKPPFQRLWALAKYERDRRLRGQVSDDELFTLVGDTYLYCSAKFDEAHPPNHGPARRGTQDRFTYFFMKKLVWKLEERRQWLRRRATADGAAYRGPRGDTYDYASARQPRSKTAMFQIVERALLQLDGRDRALLQLRYWEEASLNDIAARLGLADRFEVRRELEQVHEKVKVLVLAEVAGAILGPEDDLGPLEAA